MEPVPDERLRLALDPPPSAWQHRPGLRDAAVLAPWFTRGGADWLLFTRRCPDLPHHPGQVAFPGGARDGAEDPVTCALREAREEIGLDGGLVTVLGSLPPRVSIAGFQVHVVVGRIPAEVELRPDPREVAALFPVPAAALAERGAWQVRAPDGHPDRRPSPHFDWDGHVLWGLTARFTLDLLERLGLGTGPR